MVRREERRTRLNEIHFDTLKHITCTALGLNTQLATKTGTGTHLPHSPHPVALQFRLLAFVPSTQAHCPQPRLALLVLPGHDAPIE